MQGTLSFRGQCSQYSLQYENNYDQEYDQE